MFQASSFYINSIPAPLTPIYGREQSLLLISNQLSKNRLVTITGIGGIGKTHIALEAARRSREQFANGVLFVPLETVTDAADIPAQIASALGLPENASDPIAFLKPLNLLLVLDNYEQLLPDTDILVELLSGAPHIKLLVTSRQRLSLHGEAKVTLKGLHYTTDWPWIDVKKALEMSAVQLFVDTAQREAHDFTLTADNLADVLQIVDLLNGHPLALELAALQLRETSTAVLKQALTNNLDQLETNLSGFGPRHISITAAMSSSWQRLPDAEKEELALLTVFSSRFERQAAVEICGIDPHTWDDLRNRNLLLVDRRSGHGRLHPLVRHYAQAHLPRARTMTLRLDYATYFTTELVQIERGLLSQSRSQALKLAVEHRADHLQAWEWALEYGWAHLTGQMATAFMRYYEYNGRWREGQALFERTAHHMKTTTGVFNTHEAQAFVATSLANLRMLILLRQTSSEEGTADLTEEALAVSQAHQLHRFTFELLLNFGIYLLGQGKHARGIEMLDTAVDLARQEQVEAVVLIGLVWQAHYYCDRGEKARARVCQQEASQLLARFGLPLMFTIGMNHLGTNTYTGLFTPQTRRTIFETMLASAVELSDHVSAALMSLNLALFATMEAGDVRKSVHFIQTARSYADRARQPWTQSRVVYYEAHLNLLVGNVDQAVVDIARAIDLTHKQTDELFATDAALLAGRIALVRRDFTYAEEMLHEALTMARSVHRWQVVANALLQLGQLVEEQGDPVTAGILYHQSEWHFGYLNDSLRRMAAVAGLARVAHAQGDTHAALALVDQIINTLQTTGGSLRWDTNPSQVMMTCVHILQEAGDARADTVLRTAYVRLNDTAEQLPDQAMRHQFLYKVPANRAVVMAYKGKQVGGNKTTAVNLEPGPNTIGGVRNLTRAESEIIQLLAMGLSNKEIGARRGVTEGTTKRQVHDLYRKLGVHSRAEATALAHMLGLIEE